MYQPSATNFIGRDPMQWWIGQVTDPKKGKWDTSQEKQQGKDGKPTYIRLEKQFPELVEKIHNNRKLT